MRQMSEAHFAILRRHMVEVIAIHAEISEEELGKAVLDPRVLSAMAHVPRHSFVPAPLSFLAYQDAPLPIGFDKTISQPFIVAAMTSRVRSSVNSPSWRPMPRATRRSRPPWPGASQRACGGPA